MRSPSEQMKGLIEAGEKAIPAPMESSVTLDGECFVGATGRGEILVAVEPSDASDYWSVEQRRETMRLFEHAANARASIALAHEIAEAARGASNWLAAIARRHEQDRLDDVDWTRLAEFAASFDALLARYFPEAQDEANPAKADYDPQDHIETDFLD